MANKIYIYGSTPSSSAPGTDLQSRPGLSPYYLSKSHYTKPNLGNGYIVWDKSASIAFLQPAKGTILGVFEISRERPEEIRTEVDALGKHTYHFETDLLDETGQAVARVSKEVYVRAKSLSGKV